MRSVTFALLLLLLLPGMVSANFLGKVGASVNTGATIGTAALSKTSIEIDSSFKGDTLLIFGVTHPNSKIAVRVAGPKHSLLISKKDKIYGAWLVERTLRLNGVDSFYAATGSDGAVDSLKLGAKEQKFEIIHGTENYKDFVDKFISYKTQRLEYQNPADKVEFLADNFFRASIAVPSTIEAGIYNVEIFLLGNEGEAQHIKLPFEVRNSDFGAAMQNIAFNRPVAYGLLAILVPLIMSWLLGFFIKQN